MRGGLPRAQWFLLASLLAAVIAANIAQPYPELAPLQHAPTLVLIVAAPWLLRRWPLSTGSVALLWVFLLLHTLGGRYIYSYVPYEGWIANLTGQLPGTLLGAQRNGYDRLVHFHVRTAADAGLRREARRHGSMGGAARGCSALR